MHYLPRTLRSLATAAAGAALLLAGTAGGATAAMLEKVDGFPDRPFTIIVPYGAGGGSDQLSRAWGAALEKVTGAGVQVVNKPGGGGMAAVPDFMAAPKDGYTILESIDDAVTNHVSGKLRENPAEDWEPICMTQITFSQLYIRPDDERFSDWNSFLEYVGNLGSMERVNMKLLGDQLGFQVKQVAFDKPSERYAALIGAQVDALFEQPGDVRNFLDAGKMEPILTFYPKRPSAFSDTPTVHDVGGDFEPLLRFRGFYTHPAVPADRRAYLEEACKLAFDTDSFQKFNRSKYMQLINSYRDTAGSKKLIRGAIETYTQVYKEMGLIE